MECHIFPLFFPPDNIYMYEATVIVAMTTNNQSDGEYDGNGEHQTVLLGENDRLVN